MVAAAPRPILVASPNTALDRTLEVTSIRVGAVHRVLAVDVRAGGKGVNVARALACLGVESTVVGLVGGAAGKLVLELVAREGLDVAPVASTGETRTCVMVVSAEGATVFNEPGPEIDEAVWGRFEAETARRQPRGGVFVSSGSFPPGAPADAAARLVRAAHEAGATAILDASGAQLERALAGGPDVVAPNLAEALAVLGEAGEGAVDAGEGALERAAAAAAELRGRGARAALVTAGAAGAALVDAHRTVLLPAPSVRVRNPVGAGDSLVAGLAAGLASGDDLLQAARRGVAAAAASCESFAGGLLDRGRAEELLDRSPTPEHAS